MNEITPTKSVRAEAFDAGNNPAIETGKWYWIPVDQRDREGDVVDGRVLTCVMAVGSNYVELSTPERDRSRMTWRVHTDEYDSLVYEPNAEAYIAERAAHYQQRTAALLGHIQDVTLRIGIVPMGAEQQIGDGQNALAVVSSQVDTKAYKQELVTAKEKTLPDLFKAVEEANHSLAKWMRAPMLPMKAAMSGMKQGIEAIDDRIYTIELYAGLTEEAVKVADGDTARIDERLHVMQRRLYMDEECLLSYVGGGIEIKDITAFDAWIAKPENRDRVLPFQRTLVAFRVRRMEKDRESGGDIWRAFVNAELKNADKRTFLYVRNGEQVWRVDCDFEFDEMIFPDQTIFDPSQPMMVKMFGDRVDKMITKNAWEVMRDEELEGDRKRDEWVKENPDKDSFHNPHRHYYGDSYKSFKPFDSSNVYFDEALKKLGDEIKRYNRVAVIIQGLFDRSNVLHPHHRVKSWTPEGFNAAIELVYDATTLTYGDAPDFEAYRAELNASIAPGSIVTGQEDFWLRTEAAKANAKEERNRSRHRSYYKRYRPGNNKGPGLLGMVEDWKPRARAAVFKWERNRSEYGWGEMVPTSLSVPVNELFNVSAYKRGDFLRFFRDPRTRRDYLKWAPLMLAAEDYLEGKWELGMPSDMRLHSWD